MNKTKTDSSKEIFQDEIYLDRYEYIYDTFLSGEVYYSTPETDEWEWSFITNKVDKDESQDGDSYA